ncbi:MAG: hypothetical protein KA748_10475 [Halomonas sp.]|nr:hypothetical protein [Halomonas sp.]MBP5980621.1 hypothetical protein [Halomonas sp.]
MAASSRPGLATQPRQRWARCSRAGPPLRVRWRLPRATVSASQIIGESPYVARGNVLRGTSKYGTRGWRRRAALAVPPNPGSAGRAAPAGALALTTRYG